MIRLTVINDIATMLPNDTWSRVIILVDINAFFVSVEQLNHQQWQARPVAITNGWLSSTIITRSYEARDWLAEARLTKVAVNKLCGIHHGISRFLTARGYTFVET